MCVAKKEENEAESEKTETYVMSEMRASEEQQDGGSTGEKR